MKYVPSFTYIFINYKYHIYSMGKIIVKVRINNKTGQKSITIPKSEVNVNEGDYVEVKKIDDEDAI